jgi:2-polyprenyl-3-methyl-5-hydroxy-6-metoxy-1,4-benzoquinol methylase
MFICPIHQTHLIQEGNTFYCKQCDFSGITNEGIISFIKNPDENYHNFNAKILERIHKDENKNFWHLNRKKIILRLFNKYVANNENVIEIGAGTGNVSKMLLENGYNVAVGEIHRQGLEIAKKYGIKNLYQFDVFYPPFKNYFDVVCLFDVLEHFENDSQVLQKINTILKPGGKIVVTVPAHQWLWNRKDAVNDHKRRYESKKIKKLFIENDFKIVYASNFFLFILPFLYFRKLLNKDKGGFIKKEEYYTDKKVHPLLNMLLNYLTKLEYVLLSKTKLAIGGSISIIGQKKQ